MGFKKQLSMDKFMETIYYKKAKRIKPKKFIFLFSVFLIVFLFQIIFIYLFYIPEILHYYEELESVHKQIQVALNKIAFFSVFWGLLFLTFIISMIFYARNIQKMINGIDDYQKGT